MSRAGEVLTMGEVSRRSGLAASAIRHYEAIGLVASSRTPGGHRVFERGVLRRLAVIRAGQRVGLSLEEIRRSFGSLDPAAAPTRQQWRSISARWVPTLEARIRELEMVRDSLHACVGCGCLSMRQCALYNPDDVLGSDGRSGARRLLPTDDDDLREP